MYGLTKYRGIGECPTVVLIHPNKEELSLCFEILYSVDELEKYFKDKELYSISYLDKPFPIYRWKDVDTLDWNVLRNFDIEQYHKTVFMERNRYSSLELYTVDRSGNEVHFANFSDIDTVAQDIYTNSWLDLTKMCKIYDAKTKTFLTTAYTYEDFKYSRIKHK